jgi:hypothetical protein
VARLVSTGAVVCRFGLVLPCPATVGLGQSNHGFIGLPGRAVWSKNAVVIGARSVGGRSRQKNVERDLPVKK